MRVTAVGRAGLRTRVTAGFAAGALMLSAVMALVSYQLTRDRLLEERERTVVRAAMADAAVVGDGLRDADAEVADVLGTLDTGDYRRVVVHRDGVWYARNADATIAEAIPRSLQRLVADGRPGVQRFRQNGHPTVVVAVPLSSSAVFYEIGSLSELERTLDVLALSLTAVAVMVAAGGAGLGWYSARRVLRPLGYVADAAERVAAGGYSTRLDPTTEPDLGRLTTSFNHMVDELSARLERDRRFAADVSHELRSPLQTLSAAASVLNRRREHLDERTAVAAQLVAEEVDRFQALVDDLLELARSDQPADRAPVDVVALARQVCAARGLSDALVTVGDGTPTTWSLDRRRFVQILDNLLDNAVQYAGGPTAVRVGGDRHVCVVEVDDEGPGVHPADRTTVFDRFFRGRHANSRRRTDGTGLGLAIVAQHAAAHGGRVSVDDRPGGGARFRVDLPAEPA
jgi:signal transduction histidine kinase